VANTKASAAKKLPRVVTKATAAKTSRMAAEKLSRVVAKAVPAKPQTAAAEKLSVIVAKATPATSRTVAGQKLAGVVTKPAPGTAETPALKKEHRVVIQVSQNDPAVMNMVLNNAENLTKHYRDKGEEVQIELVAYGPGLHMVRSDTSPVKTRLKALTGAMKHLTVSGCENTRGAQAKQENTDITLLPEAVTVPTGIGRITELQEQGWTYVRP
jgi:intracellular sulfur oxidation DsrE/DsrF family protein